MTIAASESSTPVASSNPVDDIAKLLAGDDDTNDGDATNDPDLEEVENDLEDPELEDEDDGAEKLPEDSTDDEEDDSNEDSAEGDPEEDEPLYKMLGLEEDQIEVDDDGEFKLKVKVDGKTSVHNLSDVVKGFQLDKHSNQRIEALTKEKESFEAGARERVAEIEATLTKNQNLTKILEQELTAEFNSVDWQDLRQYDPAEYAAKRQDYATKYQSLQQMQSTLQLEQQNLQQQHKQKVDENRQTLLKKQYGKMIDNNPAWSDKETYKKDMKAIKEFCADTYGFCEEDFKHVSDARLIEVLKDAKKYREGAKFSSKKVTKKLPKFQKKVGSKRKPAASKLDKLTKAAKTAKGGRKRDLQTAAVAELLNGG